MKRSTLLFRNLIHYRRTNLPVIFGVAIAVAVLSGALMVGQSVRASLRRLLYERIGATEYLITAEHFFREDLARSFEPQRNSCPIIHLKGVAISDRTGIQSHDVNVYGVDERFWKFHGVNALTFPNDRSAIVGDSLAKQLNSQIGEDLLLRIETQHSIPREWLYGRRDNVGRTLRLTCSKILPAGTLGEFALRPNQGRINSIFVPLSYLQKALSQQFQINAILLNGAGSNLDSIDATLKQTCSLQDLGLRLRRLPAGNGFSLESSRMMLDSQTAQIAIHAASASGAECSPLYTYLANSIRANGKEIPYSVIAAADLKQGALKSITELKVFSPPADRKDSIWLTDWAAQNLGISRGESIDVDYFLWQDEGKLETKTASFRLAGILAVSGDVDEALAPTIPGITNARSITDWDPPFPLDLTRIRQEDEDYWHQYKTTPKAFVSLAEGQALWQSRFGNLTSLRISTSAGQDVQTAEKHFADTLLKRLNPQSSGFAVIPLKEQGLLASRGTTDFGEYFVYFSFFLIAAAILLAALFFKLTIEQRIREIGILRAFGFSTQLMMRQSFLEGAMLSITGSVLGIGGSIIYGWLMVFGLRNWWQDAIGTRHIFFTISWPELLIGAIGGVISSLCSLGWTLRSLRHNSPRMLLAGVLESASIQKRRTRMLTITSLLAAAGAILLLIGSFLSRVPQLEGFFGAGFLLLVSILCGMALYLRRSRPSSVGGNGWRAFLRLGFRNAMHRPGRSLFCASLIASATFIVVSMEAFRQDTESISNTRDSGTGGYSLLAQSSLPILYDLNIPAGQEAMNISPSLFPVFNNIKFTSFRERPGDDASCLNLYATREPTLLGASKAFRQEGRFAFQSILASTQEAGNNPWMLLDSPPQFSYVPAIVDAKTLQYTFHLSLGDELLVQGSRLNPVRLKFVALLRDSIFQGKVIISESNFLRFFPEQEGYKFFLLESTQPLISDPVLPLKEALADYGVSIERSQERLAAFHRVENTYLSTFQSLGTLGLILGTIGLASVLLRNVLERRQELALLRAVGYRMRVLTTIILAENIFLMLWGLFTGTACALLAVLPALFTRGATVPLAIATYVILAVLAAGLSASIFAVFTAFRSPLLNALRSE